MAREPDAGAVAAIYRPWVESSSVSFELEAPDEEAMARRIATSTAHAPWLVCEGPDGIHGYAYASKHRERAAYQWSVDVAVYVGEEHRKKGVGSGLYAKLFRLLRLQGFHAAHAGITLPNAASVGLHEALGFRLIGVYPRVGYKMGAWHDVGWWQLELRERAGEPAPAKTVAEAERDPAWAEELTS
jgi:L-amino acid N-acyltransferase YncA